MKETCEVRVTYESDDIRWTYAVEHPLAERALHEVSTMLRQRAEEAANSEISEFK